MKISTRIALMVLAMILVVATVIFVASRNPQPKYNDKTLSQWMLELLSTYSRRNPEAVRALRAMGKPAVVQLAEIVEREDSVLTRQILQHADKAPLIAEVVPSKHWYRYMAAMALGEIGTNAASAIPALRKMSGDSDRNLSGVATAALVLVENQSIKAYVSASLNYESTNASKAYSVLLALGPHAKEGIPAYLKELESTNQQVRLRALSVLEHICVESPECVPVFTNLLSDPNSLIRTIAIHGLGNCGELAKSATPAVAALVENPDATCRSSALIFLLQVVPPNEFQPFASLVQRATNDVDETVRNLALRVLDEKKSTH